MKQIITLIFLLLFVAIKAQAQIPVPPESGVNNDTKADEKKTEAHKTQLNTSAYLVIGGGLAIPVGNFAATSGENDGFAQTGIHGYAEAAYPIQHTNFGVAARIDGYMNNISTNKVAVSDFGSSAHFYTRAISAGFFATLPVNNNLSLDFKLLGGILVQSVSASGESKKNSEGAFEYNTSVNARYAFAKHFCGLITIGLLHTDPNYHYDRFVLGHGNIPTTLLNTSIGVGYQL